MATVMQEIAARRRAHHDARGPASVEHADAASRLWLSVLTHDLGTLALTLTPIEDLNTDPGIDPRDALLALLADAHAFLQAMDERPSCNCCNISGTHAPGCPCRSERKLAAR